jgi:outer membrane receptor protein involved in Fe transport
VQDVLFRANKTRSIRAPAITELFLPQSQSTEFAVDPCDKNYANQGTSTATRKANCAAAGIDTATFTSNAVNATVTGTTAGNTKLQSEVADAKTWGVVLRPRWIPRLNVSFDYIDIKMTNAIQQLNLTQILDACYDSPDYPSAASCKLFTRNASGQLTSYSDGFVNAGLLHFQGSTVGIDWQVSLPAELGGLEWRANYLDTKTLVLQVGAEAQVNQAGQLGAQIAAPKSKGTLSVNYVKGPFSWYWQGLYTSLRVNPWWLINSTISYDVTKAINVRLIVNNVFDKLPPFPALAAAGGGNFASATSLYFPGIIGRTYLLSADVRF